MSTPATEIAVLPLVAGSTIEDPSTDAGDVFEFLLSTIAQQEGYRRANWGRRIESPNEVQMLVDWDSVDAHKKFIASDVYKPFLKRVGSIMDGPPSIHHAHIEPLPPATAASRFSAPVTEFVTFYLPSETSEADKNEFHEGMTEFGKVFQEHADGFRGTSTGWAVEELEHPSVGTGLGYVVVVGWDSVDAHMAFRETNEFKDAMGKLGSKIKGAVMHHVKFQQR